MPNDSLPSDDDSHFDNVNNPQANACCPNGNPLINFGGYNWWINYHWSQNEGTYVWEPFKSIFDPTIIQQEPDGVRLWIRQPDPGQDAWKTSELVLTDKLGYGMYVVTAKVDGSFSNLDPNAVFGIFTYQYSEAPSGINTHREIDALEVLRGGSSNAQFTLQPYDPAPHPWSPFMIPDNTPVITSVLIWQLVEGGLSHNCAMYLFAGDHSIDNLPPWDQAIHQWNAVSEFSKYVPWHTDTSCERLHINLWLMHGAAPASEQSVKITRFQFKPLSPS